MSKFKVGNRVKVINPGSSEWETGDIFTIGIMDTHSCCDVERLARWVGYDDIEKVDSKYDELKQRIEALDNGWTKKADDILKEIFPEKGGKYPLYCLRIPTWNEEKASIEILENSNRVIAFSFSSQCSKNQAFKSALLWLLDHSNSKKDEKQEQIAELKKQVEEINKKIAELDR